MSIAAAVPTLGRPDLLMQCLRHLGRTARTPGISCVVIDNGPEEDREATRQATEQECGLAVRLEVPTANLGIFGSLHLAAELTEADVLAVFHPDTVVWEEGWDELAAAAFDAEPKLGLAGLVGSATLKADGSWHDPYSRLTGREDAGRDQRRTLVGKWTPDEGRPVAALDGCGLFFRRETVAALLDRGYHGLHHWYDKEASCAWLAAGWHLRALPVRFDHGTAEQGVTARVPAYQRDAERVAAAQAMPELALGVGRDHLMYLLNEHRWRARWSGYLPVTVDPDGEVRWRERP